MEKIKQLLHDWWVGFESRHIWIARLIVYITCLVVVVLVCFLLFRYFNLFHTDAGSARYMLSALVQSQAAIVAIVITLTLIAVQLTASAYSPRVIDIFKKNPDMWILLGSYGVSIFYGFIVLKMVEGAEGEFVSCVSISFEFSVSLAYWLGAFTFVALFPYMLNIISLLKPESIIKRLEIEITKGKILNSKDDPVRPIMDVIYGSIMKYDLETTRVGLNIVTEQAIEIIDSNSEEVISRRFCNRSERVSRLAVNREDEDSTTEVIKNLATFGESTAEKGLEDATMRAAKSLGDVERTAAEKGFENATREAASSFGAIGKAAAEKGLNDVTWIAARSLRDIGKAAAEKGLNDATWEAARSLGDIGKAAAEKGLNDVTGEAARSLGDIGKAAAEKGLNDVTGEAASSLGDIGKAAAGKGFKYATKQAARSLGDIGKAAAEQGFEYATREAAKSLGPIGKAAAGKGLNDVTGEAASSLGDVGKAAAEQGFEYATREAAKSLGDVGKAAAEQGFEYATREAARSLVAIGKAAAEQGFEFEGVARPVALSLAELTLLSEGIVKTAILERLGAGGD
jgi:hypothetical protein